VVLAILLMVLDHKFHQTEALRSALSVLAYPLQTLADLPANASKWLNENTQGREELQQGNQNLRKENLKLRAKLQLYDALRAENERLRDLLGSSYKIGNRILVAELSAMNLDPSRQQVIVRKGSNSGVYEGQAALDAHAVMGQVIHVTPLNATVLLITDPQHALPVQVLRNGLRTIATGTGRINQLELPYLPNNADIREGDLLVTSGMGKKFPAGYPVAKVSQVIREPGKAFATVIAEPQAKLDRSQEVLLVWEIDGNAYRPQAEAGLEPVPPPTAELETPTVTEAVSQ